MTEALNNGVWDIYGRLFHAFPGGMGGVGYVAFTRVTENVQIIPVP